MPAESKRLHRRVRSRDRWFVGLVVASTAIGTPLAVVLGSHGSSLRPGCVATLRQGFMGGQTTTYCSRQAVQVCRREAAGDASLAALCRRQGLTVAVAP